MTLRLSVDAAPFLDEIAVLTTLVEPLPEPLRDAVVEALHSLIANGDGDDLLQIDSGATTWAGELVFRVRPSNAFAQIMAALRAGEGDVALRHLTDSTVGCDKATVGAAGGGVESSPAIALPADTAPAGSATPC